MVGNPLRSTFINTVRGAGLTNPYGLAAVAATGQAESGYSPGNVYRSWSDPSQSGQSGTAGGVMSWRNERLRDMQDFARRRGDDPSRPSVETQALFFAQEDPTLMNRLQGAKSVEEAQGLMNGAWKFAGYDKPGGEASRRLDTAKAFLGGGIGSDAVASRGGAADAVTALGADGSLPATATAYADTGRPGSLGGLGGMEPKDTPFLKSDEFADALGALGDSLMTSTPANPLAHFGEAYSALQGRRETRNEREEARQEKLNDRTATQAVLQQAGLSTDQAKAYSSNPTAARLALDLHQKAADKASYATFADNLRPPASAAPMDTTTGTSARPAAGSSLLAPASLSDAMPTASPAASSAPAQPNQTVATYQRLQAESDRLGQIAATATTDDERQAAAAAIRANDSKLAYVQKVIDRMEQAPPGYQRTADGRSLEFIPGGPADPTVVAGNRKDAAPSDVQEYNFYRDQEQAAGRTPLSFLDYQTAGRKAGATTINTGGGGENKQVFDAVADSAAGARSAATGLKAIRDARAAIGAGGIFGAGADTRLGLQKVGAYLGVTDPTAITNTETFRAAIAPQVSAMLKSTVGSANISNTDREFAEKAAGGNIALEPTSINRLLDIMERASTEAIQGHQSRLDKVYPAGGNFERERALFGVDLPEAPKTPATSYKSKYGLE